MAGPVRAKGLGTINTQAFTHAQTHTHTHTHTQAQVLFVLFLSRRFPNDSSSPGSSISEPTPDLPSWFPGLSTPRTRRLSPCRAFRIRRDTGTRMDDLAHKL